MSSRSNKRKNIDEFKKHPYFSRFEIQSGDDDDCIEEDIENLEEEESLGLDNEEAEFENALRSIDSNE